MKYTTIIPAIVVIALGTGTVSAQEVTATADVQTTNSTTSVNAEATLPRITPTREAAKARADEMKATVKENIEARKTQVQATIEGMKEKRAAVRAEVKIAAEARKAELKAEIKQIKQERISARRDFVYQRLSNAANFITERQNRIKTMLEKMKANGKDVAAAEAQLQVSIAAVASANASLVSLKAAAAANETEAAALRALAQKAENSLKEGRAALIKILDTVAPETTTSATITTQ